MYKIIRYRFHQLEIVNPKTDEAYGYFNRFDEHQVNEIVECLNKKEEILQPILEVCNKYNIPIKDLPETLEEYILKDNE